MIQNGEWAELESLLCYSKSIWILYQPNKSNRGACEELVSKTEVRAVLLTHTPGELRRLLAEMLRKLTCFQFQSLLLCVADLGSRGQENPRQETEILGLSLTLSSGIISGLSFFLFQIITILYVPTLLSLSSFSRC